MVSRCYDECREKRLNMKKIIVSAAAAFMMVTACFPGSLTAVKAEETPAPEAPAEEVPAAEPVPMYRLYNPNSGEHFYTANIGERDALIQLYWRYEDFGWYAPKDAGDPVYRLYNSFAGEHHYTLNEAEKNALVEAGWTDEGIGWYSDPAKTVPLYREYNPNAFSCNHNYTTNIKEHEQLIANGWLDEGFAWYALKEGEKDPNPPEMPEPPKPTPPPVDETTDKAHIIYLTFDDGPSKNTRTLLDVLKKYPQVKVSFFVVNQATNYVPLIAEEFQDGHTVAVHSYTHDYKKIYKSTDAYWSDFNKMNDIVEKYTGQRSILFRFPGGSSNTVSRSYSKGIMTTLTKQSKDKGLVYFDWNVSSGDAGETTSTDKVYSNVISGIKSNTKNGRASVVLQHDSKSYSVKAVERIIQWGLQNGYRFLPLSKNSPTAHHHINN